MLSLGFSACISFTGPAKLFSTPAGIMYCKDQNFSRILSARSTSPAKMLKELKRVDMWCRPGAMCKV